jgi:spore coat polysaccharide biosynthesis predicted glycosyltransferase SpsG
MPRTPITVLADAGPSVGLGHLSRAGAVVAALRAQGHEACAHVLGDQPAEHDGIAWAALGDAAAPPGDGPLLVDSYRVDVPALARTRPVAAFWDGTGGAPPDGVKLALSLRGPEGARLACLRPMFWGLAARPVAETARRVLITTGGGAAGGAAELAQAVRAATGGATEVTLVLGPYATEEPPGGVTVVRAPGRMADVLQAADVVVTAAGQTMLEALCAGTPTVALAGADNQRAQLMLATDAGAACGAATPDEAAARATALLDDVAGRRALAAAGRTLVDGFGALRVAGRIARL